jgi:hypothetical protein
VAKTNVEVDSSDQSIVLGNISLEPADHVQIFGVWLLDTNHGWFEEIHTVWKINILLLMDYFW